MMMHFVQHTTLASILTDFTLLHQEDIPFMIRQHYTSQPGQHLEETIGVAGQVAEF